MMRGLGVFGLLNYLINLSNNCHLASLSYVNSRHVIYMIVTSCY